MREKENEEWRDIPGYEGKYQISSFGRVRSLDRLSSDGKHLKSKMRKLSYNRKGYLIVSLCKDGVLSTKTVHRLVAISFIANESNKPQINHINGIKTDNGMYNLEWCTNLDNMRHAYNTGLREGLCGESNGRAVLSQETVDLIKSKYNSGGRASEISKEFDINLEMVRYIVKNKGWKHTYIDVDIRDDRANRTEEHTKNNLISNFINNKGSKPIVVVAQYNKEGKEIKRFRSINNASIQTGIPRKTIEAVVNKKKFYNKDGINYSTIKQAGGYMWKKINIDVNQYKELV